MQFGEPPLIPASASGDSSLEPMQLQPELGIQLLCRARFLIVNPFGPGIEAPETDLRAPQLPTVEPDAAARQPCEEGPVVADHDERAGEALQPLLEPFD